MQLNADLTLPALVRSSALSFVPSPTPGITRGMLDRRGDELARATTLVRYAPTRRFPRHTHSAGEELLVLAGTFRDEINGAAPAGTYIRNPVGSEHEPFVGEDGCEVLVKLRWMRAGEPAVVVWDALVGGEQEGEGVRVRVLYEREGGDGERVVVVGVRAGKVFRAGVGGAADGGFEVFVVRGGPAVRVRCERVEGAREEKDGEEVGVWDEVLGVRDWARLPPVRDAEAGRRRIEIIAAEAGGGEGEDETVLFVKMGHLKDFVDA
ncbi:ChrR cupin-like domain-containing protein [Zopfochytrium polystomum]|nr:ChrR cupin-like domain-containing protein [Zopfochytrium polystomum]